MVVGQTGSGKTTFLNALLNFHFEVDIDDTIRYVLINEETGQRTSLSQTSVVTFYYIEAYGNNPPLIVVDTPGFGDTRGMKWD